MVLTVFFILCAFYMIRAGIFKRAPACLFNVPQMNCFRFHPPRTCVSKGRPETPMIQGFHSTDSLIVQTEFISIIRGMTRKIHWYDRFCWSCFQYVPKSAPRSNISQAFVKGTYRFFLPSRRQTLCIISGVFPNRCMRMP